uniref:Uncharacterized protein n=1 Tax=Rhizophora mucronata TaxID=61149 RepID=A0A2P2NE51_RHIMU
MLCILCSNKINEHLF